MLYQGKDGQLRILDYGVDTSAGSTRYYQEILFCEMDFSAPTARPRTDETLMMNRGNFDTKAHYVEGNDDPVYAPVPLTFSCRLNDTIDTRALHHWLSGSTLIPNAVGGTTQVYSWDESGVTFRSQLLPAFKDSVKQSYRMQIIFDGDTDYGLQYDGVYFTPSEQTITESADSLMLSANGQIYGDVTRIAEFPSTGSGTTYLAFS